MVAEFARTIVTKGRKSMDIETLRTFENVLLYANISEAARRSYLSQQTVSKRIASLEKELGCELIHRTNPITPTPAGKVLLRHSGTILNEYDKMTRLIHEVSVQPAGELRLRRYGTNTFAKIASGLTKVMVDEHQNIELVWVTTNEDDISLLQSGGIDIGFRHCITKNGNGIEEIEGLELIPLQSVSFPLKFAVREQHTLLEEPSISLRDISQYPISIPSFASNGAVTCAVVDLFERESIPATFSVVYCEALIGYYAVGDTQSIMLAAGDGFSPSGISYGVTLISPSDADYRFESFALYRADNRNRYLGYVLDKIREIDKQIAEKSG